MIRPPSVRRNFRIPPSFPNLPLVYQGWGLRRYGDEPLPLTRNFGVVYAVVQKGSPTLLTDHARTRLTAGTAFIVGIDCAMGWEDEPGAECQILIWIWRDPPAMPALRPADDHFRTWKLEPDRLAPLERIHRECRQELSQLDEYSADALRVLQRTLDIAFLRATRESSSPTRPQGESRYEIALNWMRHNLQTRHPVSELAVYLDVSESTLQRIFRRHTGRGAQAVFQAMKAEEATRLLNKGESVKAVAYRLGYQHPNDFTRFYTRHHGHPPTGANSLGGS